MTTTPPGPSIRLSRGPAQGSAQVADDAVVEAARVLLAQMGVTVEDLLHAVPARPPHPTFAEYVPRVAASTSSATRRTYDAYWDTLCAQWGNRRIDEPTTSELAELVEFATARRRPRRNDRGGYGTRRNMVSALRRVYRCAEDDGMIAMDQNPARRLRKPRVPRSTRRAIPDAQLAEINRIASTTGSDPGLDSLLMRFHVETACRRGGVLALRACDLDREHCLVSLREKGCTQREQPVSPTLMKHLVAHARERGGAERPDQPLFRQRSGRPISRKHYETLWRRIRDQLPWADRHRVSAHWLRHTTLTWVERTFSPAVARAYAGHAETSGGITGVYVKATLEEVATALAALTGEPHPLAVQASDDDPAPL